MNLEEIIKEAEGKFDEKWVNYKPPADDPYKSGIWSGGDYYQIKSFLTEQIKLAYRQGVEAVKLEKCDDEDLRSTWEAGWNDAVEDLEALKSKLLNT